MVVLDPELATLHFGNGVSGHGVGEAPAAAGGLGDVVLPGGDEWLGLVGHGVVGVARGGGACERVRGEPTAPARGGSGAGLVGARGREVGGGGGAIREVNNIDHWAMSLRARALSDRRSAWRITLDPISYHDILSDKKPWQGSGHGNASGIGR